MAIPLNFKQFLSVSRDGDMAIRFMSLLGWRYDYVKKLQRNKPVSDFVFEFRIYSPKERSRSEIQKERPKLQRKGLKLNEI